MKEDSDSFIFPVVKTNGSVLFWVDYSEVNIVSNFKAYAKILNLLDTDFFVCMFVFVLSRRATGRCLNF